MNANQLKLKVIACKVMARELAMVSWNCKNTLDITTIRQKYHDVPVKLRDLLQAEIDRIESGNDPYTNEEDDFDAIILGYGLCSNAVAGLRSKKYKLVIPRAHDCTTIFLGSKEKYSQVFLKYKGTYFYNRSWAELLPDQGEDLLRKKYQEYMEQFEDEDTVDYLMEMEKNMLAHYNNAAYITWPEIEDEEYKDIIKDMAKEKNWNYIELEGSSDLLYRLVNGDWNEEDFLVVEPGQTVVNTGDEDIIDVE